jgi:hypothetical protein
VELFDEAKKSELFAGTSYEVAPFLGEYGSFS